MARVAFTKSIPRRALRGAWAGVWGTLLLLGCASARDPSAAPDEGSGSEDSRVCVREATVAVRVSNQSSMDLRLAFGSYAPARLALGFSRTIYHVPRPYLRNPIQIRAVRGGLQIGTPPAVQTEPVFCNVATLIIGARPSYAVFYGDALQWDVWDEPGKLQPPESEADSSSPPAPAAAPDSTPD